MIDIKCKQCGKPLGKVECLVGEIYCGNTSCKAGSQIKVLTDKSLYAYEFTAPPRPPKSKNTAGK